MSMPAGSPRQRLLADTGVESVAVPGSLAGLSMNGKLLLKGRVETYPFGFRCRGSRAGRWSRRA